MNAEITNFEDDLLQEIDEESLREYNHGIAKFIRNSGTEEELQSFYYIEQELKKAGVKTELLFSDGYISLPVSAKLQVNGIEYPCLTHSMSASVANLEADLKYVGKGKPEDYAGKNVTGKLVVVEGLCMGVPVAVAEEHGAKGIIFLNDEHIHNMIGSRIWGSPSIEDKDILPKIPFVSVNRASAEKILAALTQGQVKAVLTTVVDSRWRRLPTLVGTIPGQETPEQYLMLSNHVDGWVYGAMDNASANAALLEVVKILQAHKETLKRSVKICFWSGHSHGRYAGSTWYCDTYFEDLYDHCFLHINADSLGAQGAAVLSEANSMAETNELAAPLIQAIAGQQYNGSRYGRAGDQSFWGTGTPSLFMGLSEQPLTGGTAAKSFAELMGNGKTGGFGWWWHTSEDTVDKIDSANLARDCKIYLLAAYRACSAEFLPIEEEKAAEEICGILQNYAAMTAGKMNLSETVTRAEALVRLTKKVAKEKEGLGAKVYNNYVMEMSRILVPLNYVEGSCFEHDLAVRGPSMPVLSILYQYQTVEKSSEDYKFITVEAIRKVNQVNFSLRKAIRLAETVLQLKGGGKK